jgi:hypothetical protein
MNNRSRRRVSAPRRCALAWRVEATPSYAAAYEHNLSLCSNPRLLAVRPARRGTLCEAATRALAKLTVVSVFRYASMWRSTKMARSGAFDLARTRNASMHVPSRSFRRYSVRLACLSSEQFLRTLAVPSNKIPGWVPGIVISMAASPRD